jgi:hypothetical protein
MAGVLSLKEEVYQENLLCPLWVKSRHIWRTSVMSALPPRADVNPHRPECPLMAEVVEKVA